MKRKLRLLGCLLCIGILAFALCACAKKSSIDYKELEDLLDRREYDRAIQMIRDFRDAEYVENNIDQISADMKNYVESISGTYVLNTLSTSNDYSGYCRELTITPDLVAYFDGEPAVYKLDSHTNEDNETYYILNCEFQKGDRTTYRSMTSFETDYGTIVNMEGAYYYHADSFNKAAMEAFAQYVGKYCNKEDSSDTIEVTSDFHVNVNGTTYPVEYTFDTYEETFRFAVIGWSPYGDQYATLYLSTSNSGVTYLFDHYYLESDIEFVAVTPENFFTYFEWSDWGVTEGYNAFDEVNSLSFYRYLQLKDEYVKRYDSSFSNAALEVHQKYAYENCLFRYNVATKEHEIIHSEVIDTYEDTEECSSLHTIERYDDNENRYVMNKVYLFSDSKYVDLTYDNVIHEGDIYEATGYYYFQYEDSEVSRCIITLGLVRK